MANHKLSKGAYLSKNTSHSSVHHDIANRSYSINTYDLFKLIYIRQ